MERVNGKFPNQSTDKKLTNIWAAVQNAVKSLGVFPLLWMGFGLGPFDDLHHLLLNAHRQQSQDDCGQDPAKLIF